jgi:sterol 3beta-glucosyltransferase
MRAIFTNFGSRGDFAPLLSLAHELSGHGFEPVFAVPEFAQELVRSSGFEFTAIGAASLADLRDRINLLWATNPASYAKASELSDLFAPFRSYFPEVLERLSRACEDGAVLISGPAQPVARIVHEITGIPFISIQVCHFGGSGGPVLRAAGDFLVNSFRRDVGLPPIKDPLTLGANSPQLTIYAMSPRLRPRPEDWPAHYQMTGFFFSPESQPQLDPALVNFVDAGPSPVVLTFGSMIHEDVEKLRTTIVEAIHLSGSRAVVQGFRAGNSCLHNSDPDIYWADFIPHAWIFPKCACVVQHGGAGTSAVLFRAGIPGIFVPHGDFFDQRYWGQLACELGCAVPPIVYADLTAKNLSEAIRRSIDDQRVRQAAADLAVNIRAERGVQTARHLIKSLIKKIGLATPLTAAF